MAFVYDVEVRPRPAPQGLRRRDHERRRAVWCRDQGHPALGLNVFAHNPGARALYDRLGYRVTAGLPRARRRRMPADRAPSVDLNADLGEEVTDDAGLLAVVTSANVACGFHAGHAAIMRAVCAEAARRGVAVGAQVSYRDRAGFGRVARDVPSDVLRDEVAEQVGAARRDRAGGGHGGALPEAARRALPPGDRRRGAGGGGAGRLRGDLPVLGFPGRGCWRWPRRPAARRTSRGSPTAATRRPAGRPRRAGRAARGRARRSRPQAVPLAGEVASLCVHGDSPGAVAHAHAVRRALEAAGYRLAPFVG